MAGELLLDTNVLIDLLEGRSSAVEGFGRDPNLLTSVVVLGELYYGANKSSRPAENTARVDALLPRIGVLSCDLDTARHYAAIKEHLRTKGKPIPDNDMWIAAVAKQYGLILVSQDKHFAQVDGLNWEEA